MCGIAGFATPAWTEDLVPALSRATTRIRHRGPDDEGTTLWPAQPQEARPAVGLASRRLAILDLTSSGHQPMSSSDGRWTVVLNGEIYNYLELRVALEQRGHSFRSRSDTEVLVEAWAEWGSACLERLEGMFAIAAHDHDTGRIYLARDPFGIKPLYWGMSGRTFVFASEIAAILEFPGIRRRVDPQRLYDFLTTSNTDAGDGTLLLDVRQVPSGHCLDVPVADPLSKELIRYWSLDVDREADWSFEEASGMVREQFLTSMTLHLRSDVPVGFALSGGVDSSSVLMAARGMNPTGELLTFSYIPSDPSIDEERHIDLVGRAADAVMHKIHLTPDDLRRDIDTLTSVQGEPFASPVIYAQYRVMQMARETGVKVMLGGQGADEMLAGYDRYVAARVASLLRRGRPLAAIHAAGGGVTPFPGGRAAGLRRGIMNALPAGPARAIYDVLRPSRGAGPWLDTDWFAEQGVVRPQTWSADGRRVMRETLGHNLLESQIQALMRYEDRNAMAHSLENRVPFLTKSLVELIFALPEHHLLAGDGTRKAVFRHAMRGTVPDAILDRKDKIGFSVPIMAWFDALRPWVAARLRSAAAIPGLVPSQVEMRRMTLLSGREWADPFLIWRWVSLATWVEQFDATF